MYESKKLGEILLEEGMIDEKQLNAAIDEQMKTNDQLGFVLVRMGFINEDVLYHFLAMQIGVKFVDVSILTHIEDEVIKTITGETAKKYNILPIEKNSGRMVFASINPSDPSFQTSLKYEVPGGQETDFAFVVTTPAALKDAIDKFYPTGNVLEDTLQEIGEGAEIEILQDKMASDDEGEEGDIEGANSPVVKLVNYYIEDAANKKASDIHINFYEKKIVLRYRIDGALVEMTPPPFQYKKAIISRLKLIAGLNIIEKRLPQDGRINYRLSDGKTSIDLRVSTLPSIWGENIVMRLLYSDSSTLDLAKLISDKNQYNAIIKALDTPYGMILITGPTGSGKSTTLYSSISMINKPEVNIMTAEDPVEYRLPHLIQVQVNTAANLTFPNILRSFLRQDPDIILVGEIRDNETASIAVKAALTGHLVLSTLHTNDAPATITRLIDMGIDPIYVGSSVVLVIAQKLVRKICDKCKKPVKEIDYVKAEKNGIPREALEGGNYMFGEGCQVCHMTGYKGRMAAYEIMPIDMHIRDVIFKKGTLNDLKRHVWEKRMITIRESAIEIMKKGLTTLEEVVAETLQDKPLAKYYKNGKLI